MIRSRKHLQSLILHYGPWLALLSLPVFLNGFLWGHFTFPAEAKFHNWRDAAQFFEYKPKLEALLREADGLLKSWQEKNFGKEDPSAAIQVIERLAGKNRIEIKKVDLADESGKHAEKPPKPALPQISTVSLSLEVAGSFDKLARFMSDVENETGLQMEAWNMTSTTASDQPHRLTMTITAFLQGI